MMSAQIMPLLRCDEDRKIIFLAQLFHARPMGNACDLLPDGRILRSGSQLRKAGAGRHHLQMLAAGSMVGLEDSSRSSFLRKPAAALCGVQTMTTCNNSTSWIVKRYVIG